MIIDPGWAMFGFFGLLGGLAATAIGAYIYGRLKRKKMLRERDAWSRTFAAERGFNHEARSTNLDSTLTRATHIKQGRQHRFLNHVFGEFQERRFDFVDVVMIFGAGKHKREEIMSVIRFRPVPAVKPEFYVKKKVGFGWLYGLFGPRRIQIPNQPNFNANWIVKSNDESVIEILDDARVLDAIMVIGGIRTVTFECVGGDLLLISKTPIPLMRVSQLLDAGSQLRQALELSTQMRGPTRQARLDT